MLEAIGAGLASLATPQAIAFMLIGVVYGLVVGILPGLGGIVAIALLLPFTYGYEISATLALLLGARRLAMHQFQPNLVLVTPLA